MNMYEVSANTYSELAPEWSDLVLSGVESEYKTNIYKNVKTGVEYYEIKHSPAQQQFITLVTKGILPVADVLSVVDSEGKRRFLSKKIELSEFEPDFSENELKASILFLSVIFNDNDHALPKDVEDGEEKANMIIRSNKGYFFDFETIGSSIFDNERNAQLVDQLHDASNEVLRELSVLLEKFLDRFREEDGLLFLQSILNRIRVQFQNLPDTEISDWLKEYSDEELYTIISSRAQNTLQIIEKKVETANQ